MFEFIASAQAQEAAAAAGEPSILSGILPLVLMLVVFYFLLIRPQQKKVSEHKKMVEALRKGDKVVTSGGIFGTVTKVEEDAVQLEIATETKVKLDKSSVAVVLTKPEPADAKSGNKSGSKKLPKK